MGLAVASLPFYLSLRFLVLLCLCFGFPRATGAVLSGNETDRLALLAFKAEITGNPFGALSSWNESSHFCRWSGVTCGVTCGMNLPISKLGLLLPNLVFLGASGNLFTGSVPISLSNASKLETVSMGGNRFTGNVPPLGKLPNLRRLVFSRNNLGTGEVKDLNFLPSLSNATYLSYFAINDNKFGGVLPNAICNFSTNLRGLVLSNNKITGNIPSGIENLVNLEEFHLWNNEFIGEIPSDIGKLRQLQQLSLSRNKFSGNIPMFLGNLSLLAKLSLGENYFNGNIPSNHGNCKLLVVLSLNRNNLTGTIPREVVILSSMLSLTVSENHLTGSLPIEVGSMINLEELDVSNNLLSSEIPSTISGCVKLRLLYVEANNFQGTIPSSFSNLRGLEELDLSRNNFSGKLQDFLGDFVFLQKLNLSCNDFEGMVPERGIFKNATVVFVQGNKRLCGGIPELHLQSCNYKGSTRKISSLILKLVILTIVCLVGVLLVIYFLYCSRLRRRTRVPTFEITGTTFQNVSYRSLRQATGGFSEANLIGVGGFGSVYKGVLDQGGQIVAVKVLNLQFPGASKSFLDECKALKNVKHRNLVKVLTVCLSIDYHGNDFKAMVYEFMVNGNLDEWLHPKENQYAANEDSRHLNLLQRLDIAIDVASALDYIHNHCPEPIVHCDLKPSNILLDEEMIGHVSDFGLAKFFPKAIFNSSQSHDLSSSISIRGSVGYAAPEYGMGNEVSTSGDVFSYGILLLELFTCKRPTDDMFSDKWSLHNFVKINLPKQTEGIADPRLFKQREEVEASSSEPAIQFHSFSSGQRNLECLISLLKIGIACSEELPRDRMAISDVVAQLHAIRNIHFRAGGRHGGRRDGRQLSHE